MGILNWFSKRGQAAIGKVAKFKAGDKVTDIISGGEVTVDRIHQFVPGMQEIRYTVTMPNGASEEAWESDLREIYPSIGWEVGDRVQRDKNPGGRGIVLSDDSGDGLVTVGWPDGTTTSEESDRLEEPDELTDEWPLTVEEFGHSMPGVVEAPALVAPTKDDLSARIYDLTVSHQPESHEGELQELMNQWQEVTGTPQPRFLGGRKD